jgi:ABC-type lipoprotein release transport system permease subunit
MYSKRRRTGWQRSRRRWPRSRAAGCLLWVVLLIVVLIVIAVAFGGFQKGTQNKGLGGGPAAVALSQRAGEANQGLSGPSR